MAEAPGFPIEEISSKFCTPKGSHATTIRQAPMRSSHVEPGPSSRLLKIQFCNRPRVPRAKTSMGGIAIPAHRQKGV